MARTFKEDNYTEKQNEILDVVRQLVYTKGYEQMTIQDILKALNISKGAFYHYFDSKHAVLESLVERTVDEANGIISAIVENANLNAIEKFQHFYNSISSWKVAQKEFVVALIRVWFADDNAIVRHKVNVSMSQRIAPLFNVIIQQGAEEGVFTAMYPDYRGEVVLSILIGMQNKVSALLLEAEHSDDPQQQCAQIVAIYDAFLESMERTIGAPRGALFRIDAESVQVWIDALRDNPT